VGTTGSGKSAVYNFIGGVPLKVKKDRDEKGRENGRAILEIDRLKGRNYICPSPIGHAFTSKTTAPVFGPSLNQQIVNVDCPGDFDSRDVFQSLVNSCLRV
jgi:hypothetical protein